MDSLSKFSIERLTSPAVTSLDNSRDALNGSQSRFCRWYPVTATSERQDSNNGLEGGGGEDENSKLDEVEEGEETIDIEKVRTCICMQLKTAFAGQ